MDKQRLVCLLNKVWHSFAHLNYKQGDFPVTERTADQQLSLPMFAELTDDMIDYVVASVREILA